jgi:Protein of unknown function (DUF402)
MTCRLDREGISSLGDRTLMWGKLAFTAMAQPRDHAGFRSLAVRAEVDSVTRDAERRWRPGQHIVRREVWRGSAWMGMDAIVVEDQPTHVALYVPERAPRAFVAGSWPTADGRHPGEGASHWRGHGCLMLHLPGESYAIWHFWRGQDRRFNGWYVNLEDPFRRSSTTMDTLDHEVDIVVHPDGSAELKDAELVDECVRHGRFDAAFGETVIGRGNELLRRLQGSGPWWDLRWARWEPPRSWTALRSLPASWDQ